MRRSSNKGFLAAGVEMTGLLIVTVIAILVIAVKLAILWFILSLGVSALKNYQGCDDVYVIDKYVASNLFCEGE